MTLQWGLVLSNEETWIWLHWQSGNSCFNGASFFRTRKHTHCYQPFLARNRLQWGLVLSNEETRPQSPASRSPPGASMGPRSFERGNALDLLKDRRGELASMGPRSFERGNAPPSPLRCTAKWLASMGPRSFERGNAARSCNAAWGCPCFNGASFFRTRKL